MENRNEERNVSNRAYDTFASMGLNGQEAKVEQLKHIAAHLWDKIDSIKLPPDCKHDPARLVALAKTDLESCVMWAVKALSRNR